MPDRPARWHPTTKNLGNDLEDHLRGGENTYCEEKG